MDNSWNIEKQIDDFRDLMKKKIKRMSQNEQEDLEKIIFEKYTTKGDIIHYPIFDILKSDYLGIDIPDFWRYIGEFIQHKPAVMFFNKDKEKGWYLFQDGNDIVELYDCLPLVEFYVTDIQGKYLLAYNHSQCLIATGDAYQWMFNDSRYKERYERN